MKKFYVGIKGIIKEDRGYLLLRATQGYWDTPGGRIDGDEDFLDTLKRELSEELPGSKLTSVEGLQGSFRLQKDIERDISLVLLYFLVKVELPEFITLSKEHTGYMWVNNKEDIPEGLNSEITKILSRLVK